MLSNRRSLVCTLVILFSSTTLCASTHAKPKVGSPEWHREFDRKQAEFDRKFDAAHNKRKAAKIWPSTKTVPTKRTPAFNAAAAPTPLQCLLAFRKAATTATSAEQLLPYKSRVLRENYRTAKGWGSTYDNLAHDKSIVLGLYRIDSIHINGDTASFKVLRQSKPGSNSYSSGSLTMKGEGNRWRMDSYKDNINWVGMPAASSNLKRGFPIYLESYLRRLKHAQEAPKSEPPKLETDAGADAEPTEQPSPAPQPAE
ncbi:hypothetical protein [Adhaeretor mobilis]|uniref:DUF4136 domain-containing protein n=1 Tax=Adhaeretor mobilis TaxID=1930276 RepID=A0A517N381_9BACT|nr:hypothetical protein [Adhaeretor mobilis]QDT01597.1 hypothetical protein HG15A2_49440 [Adhaeretor mobilis]